MKIDYNRLKQLNMEALVDNERSQLSSFYIIQTGVEKFLENGELSDKHTQLLIDVGVFVLTEEDIAREAIVGPFNFNQHGVTNT
jgi:hypothetical protein